MTGRKKDTAKRERIAELLRKDTPTEVIIERLGCTKQFVSEIRQEMKSAGTSIDRNAISPTELICFVDFWEREQNDDDEKRTARDGPFARHCRRSKETT